MRILLYVFFPAISPANSPLGRSLKICVLEAGKRPSYTPNYSNPHAFSNRVSSLTPTSQAFLQDLGVWDLVEKKRYWSYQNIQAWDSYGPSHLSFSSKEFSLPSLAYIVENTAIQQSLLERLGHLSTVDIIYECQTTRIDLPQALEDGDCGHVGIHFSDGRHILCKLLIGADGPNSFIRQQANFQYITWSYDHHCIVATLSLAPDSLSSNRTAYQRFLPTGTIALLPV
eukprot:Sdes_comp20736_c0_seq2m16561